MKRIDCFISFCAPEAAEATRGNLHHEASVASVTFLGSDSPLGTTSTLRRIASEAVAEFTLLYTKPTELSFVHYALERMLSVADDTGAAMVYADHFAMTGGVLKQAPVIDCQPGALRDDFDFGGVLLYRTSALKEAVGRMSVEYRFAAPGEVHGARIIWDSELNRESMPRIGERPSASRLIFHATSTNDAP